MKPHLIKILFSISVLLFLTKSGGYCQSISVKDSIIIINLTDTKDLTPKIPSEKIIKLSMIICEDSNWFVASYNMTFAIDGMRYSNTLEGNKVINLEGILKKRSPKIYFDDVVLKQGNGKTIKLSFQLIPVYTD